MTTAQDGGKVVSLKHRPPLPPMKYSWYSFLLEAESTPGPQWDRKNVMSMKNPLTLAGIEPATFRFVTQHLNQCATAVPVLQCRKCDSHENLVEILWAVTEMKFLNDGYCICIVLFFYLRCIQSAVSFKTPTCTSMFRKCGTDLSSLFGMIVSEW